MCFQGTYREPYSYHELFIIWTENHQYREGTTWSFRIVEVDQVFRLSLDPSPGNDPDLEGHVDCVRGGDKNGTPLIVLEEGIG